MKKVISIITIALLLVIGCIQEERFVKVAEQSVSKAVMITVSYNYVGEVKKVSGSGVFITEDGHILTCRHLFTVGDNIEGLKLIKIASIEMSDGRVVPAELICISEKSDLALMKADVKGVKYATLADPRKLKVGQEVIAIGNPLRLPFTVTSGIISALYRDLDIHYNVTQSDTSLNPGNSGGPLFNLKGELVGINSFMICPVPFFPTFTGLGFSVQSGQCLEFLVKSKNKISPHRKYKWLKILNRIEK